MGKDKIMITQQQIIEYYDSCEIDYQTNWHLEECLAMHIGYWDKTTKTLPQALMRQNEIMVEKCAISEKDMVLDAGCGVGGSSIYISQTSGCKVVGITLSKKQATSATQFSTKRGVQDRTNFFVMDYCNTGFANDSFDVVWALESSCYAESKKALIEEAFRILKKGGRLIIADGFEVKDDYSSIERKIIDLWVKRWAVQSLESLKSFNGHLHNAGFVNIEYEDITKNVTPSSRRLFLLSIISWPFAKILQLMRKRSKIQNDNLSGAFFQYLVLKLKLGSYGMFYAEKK